MSLFVALLGSWMGGPVAMGYAAAVIIGQEMAEMQNAIDQPLSVAGKFTLTSPGAQAFTTVTTYLAGIDIVMWLLDHT